MRVFIIICFVFLLGACVWWYEQAKKIKVYESVFRWKSMGFWLTGTQQWVKEIGTCDPPCQKNGHQMPLAFDTKEIAQCKMEIIR